MKHINRPSLREIGEAYLFNAPLIFLTAAFIVLPVIGTLVTSLHQDVTFMAKRFVGLDNYAAMFSDPQFRQATYFTVGFTVASITIEMFLGTLVALVLNEKLRLRGLLRVAVLIPWAIPIAVSAKVWELIYNYEYGLLNYLAQSCGLVSGPINWLGTSAGAFWAIVLSDVWKTTPFVSIILLAGLSAIPRDLHAQAAVDGATAVQRFFRITLPLLKPVLVVALIFRTIDAIRVFDIVYVLTRGGPGGTTTSLSLYAFKNFLTGDFGYGSAVSIVIFTIALCFSIFYVRLGGFTKVVQR